MQATHKRRADPLTHDEANSLISAFSSHRVIQNTYPLLQEAFFIKSRYITSLWDAIIIAAANQAKCQTLYEMIEEFGDINKEWFRKWLKLPNGIPSYNTFARVIEALDPKVFSQCIATHLQLVLDNETLEGISRIAIDGKAMRGSATEGETHLHAVSAWGCGLGVTLGQSFVDEKSNEITAIPELLNILNLEGAVVTIDAMGTQKDIASQIKKQGGDYLLSAKANQKGLYKEISDYFLHSGKDSMRKALSSDCWDKYFQDE